METNRPQRQFRIHHCLGRGGYGEVYRATMLNPGGIKREVALKLLRLDMGAGSEAVRRLRDEGRMLGVLRHPTILRVHDLALLEGRVGLVTEYVEGQDLSALVGVDRLPPRAVIEVISAVAEALDVAWRTIGPEDGRPLHLVHRDIKPSNIRLSCHGEVKLLDFGIARSVNDDEGREARTGTGSAVGSLPYMAPERFTRAPVSASSDVYALGCTMFEGLVGRRLFPDPVPVEMFRLASDADAHCAHVTEAMGDLPDDLNARLADLIRRALLHEASDRPTAAEMAAACDTIADEMPGQNLKRWARDRQWPDPRTVPGHFDGRTITEGTLSTSASGEVALSRTPFGEPMRTSETYRFDVPDDTEHTLDPAPAREPSTSRRSAAALALSFGGILGVVGLLWFFGTDPAPVQVPAPEPASVLPAEAPDPVPPAPVLEPAPTPPVPEAPAPVVAPLPVPAPAPVAPPPVRPQPSPAVASVPDPIPVPDPVVVPDPEPVQFGGVALFEPELAEVRGLELRSGHGAFGLGDVPEGRYELFVDFGHGFFSKGPVVVAAGGVVLLECNPINHSCSVRR